MLNVECSLTEVLQYPYPLSRETASRQWLWVADALETAEGAARLSRGDLATALVTEMTGLAGSMGRHYAVQSGVDPQVAEASLHTWHMHRVADSISPLKRQTFLNAFGLMRHNWYPA